MDTSNAEAIILRLKEATHAMTDTELAGKLGISKQSISSARKNNRVPDSWLSKTSESYGKSIDWLKWGSGAAAVGTAAIFAPAAIAGTLATGAMGIIGGLFSKALSTALGDTSLQSNEQTRAIEAFLTQIEAMYGGRISELEKKLELAECERRELNDENRELWKKVSSLQDELRKIGPKSS